MYILRTRIKKDIISEFLPPSKPSQKVIVLCSGMPSYPSKKEVMLALAKKGYWVFMPRYRGTWESDGHFLKTSPSQDILDLVNQLPNGFEDLWSGKMHKIKNPTVYLIGSSFGGPAALFASKHKSVRKVVVLSPVIDWTKESNIEPLNFLQKFTERAFGNGYRFKQNDWDKLKTGRFYNPATQATLIDPKKVLIIQTKDDKIVSPKAAEDFAEKNGIAILMLKIGGHLSLSSLVDPSLWGSVKKFISN